MCGQYLFSYVPRSMRSGINMCYRSPKNMVSFLLLVREGQIQTVMCLTMVRVFNKVRGGSQDRGNNNEVMKNDTKMCFRR